MSDYDDGARSSRAGGATKTVAKKAGKSAAKWIIGILGIKVIAIGAAILLVLLLIAAAAGAKQDAAADTPPAACGAPIAPVTPGGTASAGTTAEQWGNAQTIAGVALSLGLGRQGALVGIDVAITESTLINVGFGDIQNGSMTTSRGLFQQIAAWGPLADRMDPVKSATMFYTGGQAGQRGLTDVAGWQQMPVPQAAQAVQGSEFGSGSNYAGNLTWATSITDALMAGAPTVPTAPKPVIPCPPGSSGPIDITVNGVAVTIPDHPDVAAAVRGKVIQAPNAGIAKGLAAGFGTLGTLYVWGGGFGPGGGATDGCARGGGALNSCQGQIGWDCSGLTNYVLVQGGFPSPGGESGTQRSTGTDIPWAQGLPGDIVGFPGHVAIYLGVIDGTRYILEASDVGTPNRVVAMFRTDFDPSLHRHWS